MAFCLHECNRALVLLACLCFTLRTQTDAALTRDDFVVALPVDVNHLEMAEAGRLWRQGIRTLIANNLQPNESLVEEGKRHTESWTWYPDDEPLRSLYPGDTRAAIVPFLAHKYYGDTYKWMLYGDDDTVFFMEGIMELLAGFDHEMPYLITDHMWFNFKGKYAFHPSRHAPRCLPCNYTDEDMDKSKLAFEAPKGCPCTPQLLCKTDKQNIFDEKCSMPRAPAHTYSIHGGAGALISVGLMKRISLDWMEKCLKSLVSTGGDAFISLCIWEAGYFVTDPGYSFYHPEVQMFDPGPEDRMGVMMRLARALNNKCDAMCRHQLDYMMTLHIRSRLFPSISDAARFMRALLTMYMEYSAMKREHQLHPEKVMTEEQLQAMINDGNGRNYAKLVELKLLIPGQPGT